MPIIRVPHGRVSAVGPLFPLVHAPETLAQAERNWTFSINSFRPTREMLVDYRKDRAEVLPANFTCIT